MPSELATRTDRVGAGPSDRPPERRPIQDRLGRYQLERVLGTGGMGVVYRAFDPELARRVALKVLRPEEDHGGSDAGHDYIVMELVEGVTLARWLRDSCPARARIVEAFVAAGRGLAAAHAAGMVHRDFKPDNVLRTLDGRVVVGDFGLARSEPELPNGMPAARGTLPTLTHGISGTPAYMAPEQWAGETITPAADQWSFCVALWEALAGERPFGKVTIEVAATSKWELPTSAPFPRAIRKLLARGLDPDPAKRWPDLETLLERLEATQALHLHTAGAGAVVIAIAAMALGANSLAPLPDGAFACDEPATDDTKLADARAQNVVDEDARRTLEQRGRACSAETPRRAEISCLDGVLARQTMVRRSNTTTDVGGLLVDPAVCSAADPARLVASWEPGGPCMRAMQLLAQPSRIAADTAVALAQVCGDDRVQADALLGQLHHQVERDRFRDVERALRRTTDAIRRVEQPDLGAMLLVERARYAASRHATAERLRYLDAAIELLAERRPALRSKLAQERIEADRAGAAALEREIRTHRIHEIHKAKGGDEHPHDHEHHDHDE